MDESKKGIMREAISGALSSLIVAMLSAFLWAIPVKVIWNVLLVQTITIAAISYWQAVCIVLVFKLITSPIKRG